MSATPSIFAQIVDQVRLMNEEQQKILWLQLNQESIYAAAAKADSNTGDNNVSMDEITKMSRHVRRGKPLTTEEFRNFILSREDGSNMSLKEAKTKWVKKKKQLIRLVK